MAKKHKSVAALAHEYSRAAQAYHAAGETLRKCHSSKRRSCKAKYMAAKRHYHAAGKALMKARNK